MVNQVEELSVEDEEVYKEISNVLSRVEDFAVFDKRKFLAAALRAARRRKPSKREAHLNIDLDALLQVVEMIAECECLTPRKSEFSASPSGEDVANYFAELLKQDKVQTA